MNGTFLQRVNMKFISPFFSPKVTSMTHRFYPWQHYAEKQILETLLLLLQGSKCNFTTIKFDFLDMKLRLSIDTIYY